MDLLADLIKIGFTEYEAKVYLALLREYPATGYQLSKESGVPRSMVYEALRRLHGRGAALETVEDRSTLYRPLPPQILLDRHQSEHQRLLQDLEQGLNTLYTSVADNRVWAISGRTAVLAYAAKLIREAQTERYLMDAHGMFYELPALVYDGRIWGVRPIATHLRIVPDFCHWRGMFVMASDQTDNAVGQPQSGLWFGNIDALWSMGKPAGWGGPWWDTPVTPDEPSDPFLMTGFDKKCVHITHQSSETVGFTLEVDFLGDGTWQTYDALALRPGSYYHHEFPDGFSAHWIRVRVSRPCTATVYFTYS